jgi:hypothetical protein
VLLVAVVCLWESSKIWLGNIFFVWRGVVTEFDYFKKFQVFDFLKSLALAKSCHKMRSGGKIFFKLSVPARNF